MTNHKKVVFCASDLEEKYYRGIGFYAQSVIKTTKKLGYTNYLLTSAKSNQINNLQQLNILRKLDDPIEPSLRKIILDYLSTFIGKKQSKEVNQVASSYYNNNKLNYLSAVDGYINQTSIYKTINLHAVLSNKPFDLETKQADILFTAAPSPVKNKYKNGLTIQTIHDLIPLVTLYHPPAIRFNSLFYKNVLGALEYSDLILTISEFSKQEILQTFPQSKYEDKIKVIYQPIPIDEEDKKVAENQIFNEGILNKYKLEKQNYILYVGALEMRKNIDLLIDAYSAIKDKIKMPLILVGSLGYGKETFIEKIDINPDTKNVRITKRNYASVRHIGYVNDLEKLILLRNANCFVFPSLYEGFGLPSLEAMAMGCPVLTSKISAIPEACQDAALYVNPNSIPEIAEGILEMVNNNSLREELIAKGEKLSSQYTFDNYQSQIATILSNT
ncbi:glycosyltransferase family 4 protein [Cyanobacterium stanieri LEGE 03274]|uniref:Glycosyltransferase family 4 protein n=1 Tax=Cyanobacterium stanieri LEGE 03274 TaxID=1828756 RepID=A0ABR9V0E9_9CHRO|nr:glycosyltransferase family 1 protein [Cyanobacterium stanieri]MBE9221354.1 glycosyltransferase family 4 protein [Cyanobacterium stanieri LEGE 03274]